MTASTMTAIRLGTLSTLSHAATSTDPSVDCSCHSPRSSLPLCPRPLPVHQAQGWLTPRLTPAPRFSTFSQASPSPRRVSLYPSPPSACSLAHHLRLSQFALSTPAAKDATIALHPSAPSRSTLPSHPRRRPHRAPHEAPHPRHQPRPHPRPRSWLARLHAPRADATLASPAVVYSRR